MDGDVAIPSKYFTPTPFSKWNIEMGSEFNPNNLTGITMIFIGSAVVYARAIN
jgi:hypothetical protein